MPSNRTKNYQLSQWEKSDKVLMDDFNADNLAIDAAIKAEADARAALEVQVAAKASQADLNAEVSARKSLNTSVSKLGNCRVEYFTADLNPGGSMTPTLYFSAQPELFFLVGNTFLMGSRHMNYLKHFYSSSSSLTSGSVLVTWTGSYCNLASSIVGTYDVFAFYREDL